MRACSRRTRDLALSGYVLFDDKYIQYFTGFNFLATERPVAVASNLAGELAVFVPEFEVERVKAETDFERIESYPEYPGREHPMKLLARRARRPGCQRRGRRRPGRLSGHPRLRGPAAERGHGRESRFARRVDRELMRIKSKAEIELIRESAKWCAVAHRLLQRYSGPGATEAEARCARATRRRSRC